MRKDRVNYTSRFTETIENFQPTVLIKNILLNIIAWRRTNREICQ